MSTSTDVIPSNRAFTSDNRHRLSEIFERDVEVLPVSTGTAANCLSLAALTPPWGSVLCHPDSHINIDESTAPEFFTGGAKLATVPGDDSKTTPARSATRCAARSATCTVCSRPW